MSIIGNPVTFGGGSSGYAYIGVQTTVGATLTCTDGITTLVGDTSQGQYYTFIVPNSGLWTVTATDTSGTKTKTVSVTQQGQCLYVVLMKIYLFKTGDTISTVWNVGNNGASNPTSSGGNMYFGLSYNKNTSRRSFAYTKEQIDLTNYTKISVTYSGLSSYAYNGSVAGIYVTSDVTPSFNANGSVSQHVLGSAYRSFGESDRNTYSGTWTVDLTSMAGFATFVLTIGQNNSGTTANRGGGMTISQVVLE